MAGDVWIAQSPLGSTPGGTGTVDDPYTVPEGDTTTFDSLVNAQPAHTAFRLRAGTFLTRGSSPASTVRFKEGSSLEGSGIGITTVKVADNSYTGDGGVVITLESIGPDGQAHGSVKNLTVDCNFDNQSNTILVASGISASGHSLAIEDVEVINLGSRVAEAFGIFTGNFQIADIDLPSHVVIRNCIVHKPSPNTTGGISAISPCGHNVWSGLIEGCFVDMAGASATSAGCAFAGSTFGLVIAHNNIHNCLRGVHVDTRGLYGDNKAARNVIIHSNGISACATGIGIGGVDDTPATGYFENFVIQSNSIEMEGSGEGIHLWGSTTGFQVKDNIISVRNNNLAAYKKGIVISDGAYGHVVKGNRFSPSGDPKFEMVQNSGFNTEVWKRNTLADNTWVTDTVKPITLSSTRFPNNPLAPLPAGSSLWRFFMGSYDSDTNPGTSLVSSDLNGANPYEYMRFSRAPGGFVAGHNLWLDTPGTSGVYIGDGDSGKLTVGGIIQSKSGFNLAQGAKMVVTEGGTASRMGAVTLSCGTVTVNTTAVKANSRIFLTSQQSGGTPGVVGVSARVNGTSFTITSSSATDTSNIAWFIVDPS